ncbi:hypothetical protein F511_44466 [Dorcoceras hygrometricum]|uniref:Uncharacterized protein n=1 Tax=Dorcoceras hygrometricum TaxID=472368 RepID=A0A2Z7CGF6_9LAMI|nr:hypothetical protein F511_44466 [Dorcoceras hygrometricum]
MGLSKSIVSLLNVDLRTLINNLQHNSIHNPKPKLYTPPPPLLSCAAAATHAPSPPSPIFAGNLFLGRFDEENPFVKNSSVFLVQPDEGVSVLVVDRIGDYLPQSTEKSRVLVIPVGARHKCQQDRINQRNHGIGHRPPRAAAPPHATHRSHALGCACRMRWPRGAGRDVRAVSRNAVRLMSAASRMASRVHRELMLPAAGRAIAHRLRDVGAPLRAAQADGCRSWRLLAMRAGRATLRAASCAAAVIFVVVAPPPADRRSGESPAMS